MPVMKKFDDTRFWSGSCRVSLVELVHISKAAKREVLCLLLEKMRHLLLISSIIWMVYLHSEAQIGQVGMQDSIDKTIEAVYKAICFLPGQPPNMPKIKKLFTKHGIMINYNGDDPLILSVDEFIDHFAQQVKSGALPSLEDKEVHAETKIFGRIAHRFSFYEARFTKDDAVPFAMGVNSLQLIKEGTHWKITAMAWNDDNRGDGFFKRVVGF